MTIPTFRETQIIDQVADKVASEAFRARQACGEPHDQAYGVSDADLAVLRTALGRELVEGEATVFQHEVFVAYEARVAEARSAAARALGSHGGRANTPAQQAARRQNGKRGGRPRKQSE